MHIKRRKGEDSYRLFPWIKKVPLLLMNETLIIWDEIWNGLIDLYKSSFADVFGCLVSSVCGMLGRVKVLDVGTRGASRLADDPCAFTRASSESCPDVAPSDSHLSHEQKKRHQWPEKLLRAWCLAVSLPSQYLFTYYFLKLTLGRYTRILLEG